MLKQKGKQEPVEDRERTKNNASAAHALRRSQSCDETSCRSCPNIILPSDCLDPPGRGAPGRGGSPSSASRSMIKLDCNLIGQMDRKKGAVNDAD